MRAAIAIALISSAAFGQGRVFDRTCDVVSRRSSRGGVYCSSRPTFQFAPASGAGMGLVCSGTNPTGSSGQAVTVSRSSSRVCMKGSETENIAPGDLVLLGPNLAAVQQVSATNTQLGVSAWESRTNQISFSQELTHAPWVSFGDVSAPTVTANFALAPDGTKTATRVQFTATDAAHRTMRFIDNTTTGIVPCPVGIDSASIFLKGCVSGALDGGCTEISTLADGGYQVADGGVWDGGGVFQLDLQIDDGSSGWIGRDGGCGVNPAYYRRCLLEAAQVSNGGGNVLFAFGNLSSTNGGVARGAADVLAWGAQCELGVVASPYIPVVDGGTGTRTADRISASYTATGPTVSLGGIYSAISSWPDSAGVVSMTFDSTNETRIYPIGAKLQCTNTISSIGTSLLGVGNALTPAATAGACGYASGSQLACFGSTCTTAATSLTLPAGAATLWIGGQGDGGSVNGTVANICADSRVTGCRTAGASTATCPYPATEAQKVALIGDSIMKGAAQIAMVDEINDRLCASGKAAAQFAVSGSTISDCQSQYTTSVKGHSYRAVATECGINNLLGGESAATAWAKMLALLSDISNDGGFPVVLGNLTPCHGYATCDDTKVAAFNAFEASWCADAGTRATCLDNHTLLGSGSSTLRYDTSPGDTLGSLCLPSTDYLHPNNYCSTKLADAFADAVP